MDIKALVLVYVLMLPTVFSGYSINSTSKGHCPNLKTSLGSVRKRRHLAFPPGSTASVTASIVKTFMTHVPSGWYLVIEAEVVYQLPDATFVAAQKRKKLRHRQKREVWELLRSALDARSMNGRSCVLRTICEAQIHLAPKGKSLVHDILRAIFTAPLHDEEFMEEMGDSYNELLESDFCEKDNDCPFSFINFILDLNQES